MKNLLFVLSICTLVLFASCDEDEPKIDPIVGLWELDRYEISDAPSGFSNVEERRSTAYDEDSYTIEFFTDFNYNREIEGIPGFGDVDDEGEWSLNNGELELDSDDDEVGGVDYTFNLDEDITDRELILSASASIIGLSDQFIADFQATQDTITTEESFNQIINENIEEIFVTATYEFDRVTN